MPVRKTPLVAGEYYHIFNRSVNKIPIFVKKSDCLRAIKALNYYRFENPPMRLSYFLSYGVNKKDELINKLQNNEVLVEIICYCLMPNHYHLLLKQIKNDGISKFISLFQNSITKYRNTKYKLDGPMFKGPFKSVFIEDENQFLHLQRYIHLNPYTSYAIKYLEELNSYRWSSYPEYLGKVEGFCKKEYVMSYFSSIEKYEKFILNQSDYQRKLELIKHLTFE